MIMPQQWPEMALRRWSESCCAICRAALSAFRAKNVRSRPDSVAKLGKRRLTRDNRIGAKDLLNRCCALVAVLESMLPARAPKIVLQQNRPNKRKVSGRIGSSEMCRFCCGSRR